jgi:hypothetical protein
MITARAAEMPGCWGTGRTRREAADDLIHSLRPELPTRIADSFSDITHNLPGTQSTSGRYWRNLVRGWPGLAALLCLWGGIDLGGGDKSGRGEMSVGAGSLIIWGLVVLLNLGGAGDTMAFSRGRQVRYVNGIRQGKWRIRATALAAMAVGAVIILAVRLHR